MAEEPPALSPQMRALLRGYRDANAMPKAAKARVHDRLREPAGRPAWLWAGVGAVAAALLLWGALSVTGALQSGADDAPHSQAAMQATAGESESAAIGPAETETKVAPPQRRVPAPVADEPEPPLEPAPSPEPPAAVNATKPDPPRRRLPKREVTPEPEPEPTPQTPASRLGAENRLIAQTWEHVRAKRYAKARETLAEHAREFPDGVLAPERRALKVIVDCLANPDGAAGKADAYAQSGRKTLLAKVRSACGEEKSTAQ